MRRTPTRVVVLAVNYPPATGGAQYVAGRLAEGFAARPGREVTVVTTTTVGPPAGRDPGRVDRGSGRENGVDVIRVDSARWGYAARRLARRTGRRLARRADRLLGRNTGEAPRESIARPSMAGPLGWRWRSAVRSAATGADVVVGLSAPFTTMTEAPTVARRAGAASIILPMLHLSRPVADEVVTALRSVDRLVVYTVDERDFALSNGVDPTKVRLIRPGIDMVVDPEAHPLPERPTTVRQRLGVPDRPTVGFVGRFARHKGLDVLLDTVDDLPPDVGLLVAGASTGWDELDERLDALVAAHPERITVRRNFPDTDRHDLLAACDVLAFPSREESFGLVIPEAWQAGRPVVVADIPAVRCLVTDGVDGLLVPVGDAHELATALSTLLSDLDRATAMGIAGRRRVVDELTWDHALDAWNDLIDEVVAVNDGASG